MEFTNISLASGDSFKNIKILFVKIFNQTEAIVASTLSGVIL